MKANTGANGKEINLKINHSNECSVPLKLPGEVLPCDVIPSVPRLRYKNEVDASSWIHFLWNSANDDELGSHGFGKIKHFILHKCVVTSGAAWVPADAGYPKHWPGFFLFTERSAHQELP